MDGGNLVGQSAIEYLMTYGWMLLVVAVTGGAIFATVGNQSVESTSGFSGSDVIIDDFGVTGDNELGLSTRNGAGNEIAVSRVNVSDPDTGNFVYKEFTGDNRIGVGSEKIFELPNVTRGDGSNSLNIEIIYDSEGLTNLSVSGTVSGDLELTDSGSYEGLPEDDHQSINDGGSGDGGGSLSLMQTVNYTYDDSGGVQVNESTAGSDGYRVDLNNDFFSEVQEIEIVEMHGADGGDGEANPGSFSGGSGGLIESYRFDVTSITNIEIWVGEKGGGIASGEGGWGRSKGGSGGEVYPGEYSGGGGSTEILADSGSKFVAAADAGGGGYGQAATTYDGGGGARGGLGYNKGGGSGFGGQAGNGTSRSGESGAYEINSSLILDSVTTSTGGSSDGSGWILLEYYG